MKKEYESPQMTVLELDLRIQLMQATVPLTDEEADEQW